MFGFGKKLTDKFLNAKAAAKKIENKDLMEAIIAGCVLVAFADGELEPSEEKSLADMIQANENLRHFGTEIGATIERFVTQMRASKHLGKIKIMRELGDVKNNPRDAEEVFANMVTIAEADGEVEPEELKVLKEVGSVLGIRLADFGITT